MDEIGIENDVQNNGGITEETKEEQETREEPTGAVEDEKIAHDQAEMESLQDIQEEASKQLTDKERLVLYKKGIRLKRKGNARHALHCFLGCLQGLKERDSFSVLPECLHYIAEIYSEEEDYEVAIQFAQAEKLYYETALITVDREIKPESGEENVSDSKDCPSSDKSENTSAQAQGSQDSDEAQKAEEYEKLAHMCLKQQNPQLALDYCAKAVKLQQSCYGEQHPVTLQTLDLFTVIYAEMGKQQYKAALDKFSAAQEMEKEAKLSQEKPQTSEEDKKNKDNTSSAAGGSEDDETKTKSQDECQQPDTETPTSQDTVQLTLSSSWALALYFIVTISIAVALTTALCYLTQTDIHTTFTYMTTRLRFYYYYYFQKAGSSGNQYF